MMSNVRFIPVFVLFCLLCVPEMMGMRVGAQIPFSCADVTEIPTIECSALVAFYHSTNGDDWNDSWSDQIDPKEGWLQTTTPCSWHGVVCSDNHVVKLHKSNNRLSGVIPAEILNLTHLITLYHSGFNIMCVDGEPEIVEAWNSTLIETEPLLACFTSCDYVTTIPMLECEALIALYDNGDGGEWMSPNGQNHWLRTPLPCYWYGVSCTNYDDGNVSGLNVEDRGVTVVPAEIGNLTRLRGLNLGHNQLTTLPAEIGNLVDLESLYLDINALTMLPDEFWNLTNLSWLDLIGNDLTHLPPEIGNLTQLSYLDLNSNDLTTIPPEIGNLTRLTVLDLQRNQLTIVPAEIGNLVSLIELRLQINHLTAIPPEIGNLVNLTWLDLYSNGFVTAPAEIVNLTRLGRLSLSACVVDADPAAFEAWLDTTGSTVERCSSFSSCADVTEIPVIECEALVAFYHSTNGDAWGRGSTWLQTDEPCSWSSVGCSSNRVTSLGGVIRSGDNRDVTGAIPAEIADLTALTILNLYGNSITTLPPEIGNLTNLVKLDLHRNQLTTVPAEIGNLTNLIELNLDSNQLTTIPVEIGNLTNLTGLSLCGNALTDIPAEIWDLTNLTGLNLCGNTLTTIPAEIGNLTNLAWLSLQNNQLSTLPTEILELTSLEGWAWGLSFDANVCIDATPNEVETWATTVGLSVEPLSIDPYLYPYPYVFTSPPPPTAPPSCSAAPASIPTSVTINFESNQAKTSMMDMIYVVLFLIGTCGTMVNCYGKS